jgi:hypothetical protein
VKNCHLLLPHVDIPYNSEDKHFLPFGESHPLNQIWHDTAHLIGFSNQVRFGQVHAWTRYSLFARLLYRSIQADQRQLEKVLFKVED